MPRNPDTTKPPDANAPWGRSGGGLPLAPFQPGGSGNPYSGNSPFGSYEGRDLVPTPQDSFDRWRAENRRRGGTHGGRGGGGSRPPTPPPRAGRPPPIGGGAVGPIAIPVKPKVEARSCAIPCDEEGGCSGGMVCENGCCMAPGAPPPTASSTLIAGDCSNVRCPPGMRVQKGDDGACYCVGPDGRMHLVGFPGDPMPSTGTPRVSRRRLPSGRGVLATIADSIGAALGFATRPGAIVPTYPVAVTASRATVPLIRGALVSRGMPASGREGAMAIHPALSIRPTFSSPPVAPGTTQVPYAAAFQQAATVARGSGPSTSRVSMDLALAALGRSTVPLVSRASTPMMFGDGMVATEDARASQPQAFARGLRGITAPHARRRRLGDFSCPPEGSYRRVDGSVQFCVPGSIQEGGIIGDAISAINPANPPGSSPTSPPASSYPDYVGARRRLEVLADRIRNCTISPETPVLASDILTAPDGAAPESVSKDWDDYRFVLYDELDSIREQARIACGYSGGGGGGSSPAPTGGGGYSPSPYGGGGGGGGLPGTFQGGDVYGPDVIASGYQQETHFVPPGQVQAPPPKTGVSKIGVAVIGIAVLGTAAILLRRGRSSGPGSRRGIGR